MENSFLLHYPLFYWETIFINKAPSRKPHLCTASFSVKNLPAGFTQRSPLPRVTRLLEIDEYKSVGVTFVSCTQQKLHATSHTDYQIHYRCLHLVKGFLLTFLLLFASLLLLLMYTLKNGLPYMIPPGKIALSSSEVT